MQQELGRLAHRAHEQEEACERQRVPIEADKVHRLAGKTGRRGENLIEGD